MAKYKIAHRWSRVWVGETESGFDWVPYEQAKEFQNYFKAKAALDSMPVVRDSYNFPVQHFFMKVSE